MLHIDDSDFRMSSFVLEFVAEAKPIDPNGISYTIEHPTIFSVSSGAVLCSTVRLYAYARYYNIFGLAAGSRLKDAIISHSGKSYNNLQVVSLFRLLVRLSNHRCACAKKWRLGLFGQRHFGNCRLLSSKG